MIKQRDAKDLAAGYLSGYRVIEVIALIAFCLVSFQLIFKIFTNRSDHTVAIVLALFFGLISSDFVSGLVHWAADTWGSADWPILGKTLIRPFREHHVDPLAMTRHDLIESSGSTCLISLPIFAAVEMIQLKAESAFPIFFATWITSMVIFSFFTAHIHIWAHRKENPSWVVFLQKSHLILSSKNHSFHHVPPFQRNYCMTTGWLNPFLNRIQFFAKLERIITAITGALPRKDDIGEEAARAIIE
jgi:ubiquitin-conjugating enzyme E2 variant